MLFLISCEESYNKEKCLDLYTRSYRGHPPSARLYQDHCQTPELKSNLDCQKALEALIVGRTKSELEKTFGEKVTGCFSENDHKNFPYKKEE